MIWKKLKTLFTKRQHNKDGNFPPATLSLTECYAEIDTKNRWQGDIYPKNAFWPESLPTQDVPYWMLLNRTCQLYEGEGRRVKLPYLNYIAVYPINKFVSVGKTLKNQIDHIIKKQESVIFMPAYPEKGIDLPLVGNFNLVYTFALDSTPSASKKILQLSSPFCEHTFQKFARFFYTVGFDDSNIKSKEYITLLVKEL